MEPKAQLHFVAGIWYMKWDENFTFLRAFLSQNKNFSTLFLSEWEADSVQVL